MKTLPLSTGLTMSRNLIDVIFPKPGSNMKAPDFMVLSDGENIYVRCLNGGNYNFQPKAFDDLSITSSVSPSECIVNADKVCEVVVKSNLDRDRVVMVEARKSPCDCGKRVTIIVRIPSIRTGCAIHVENDAQMHDHLHRKAANGHTSNPFANMFGGGVRFVNLGDLMSGGEGDLGKIFEEADLGGLDRGRRTENGSGHPGRNGNRRRKTAGSGANS